MSFSTDTPPLFFEMEGMQEVSLALGHDEPVSIIDHKNRKSYSDERINNRKSLFWTSHFCNLRRFVVINATNRLKLSLSG